MKVGQLLELVRARLSAPAASWIVTTADKVADHLAAAAPTPRYVWVVTRGRIGPAGKIGGNPRPLYTRELGVELHLWTASLDDAETRLEAVIGALHAEAATSVRFVGENWFTESLVGRGFLVTLTIEVSIPVTRATVPTHQATDVAPDTSGAAPDDGVLQWGEE